MDPSVTASCWGLKKGPRALVPWEKLPAPGPGARKPTCPGLGSQMRAMGDCGEPMCRSPVGARGTAVGKALLPSQQEHYSSQRRNAL